MQSLDVVEALDVVADGGLGGATRAVPLIVDQLGSERGEEALGDGVDAPMFVKPLSSGSACMRSQAWAR